MLMMPTRVTPRWKVLGSHSSNLPIAIMIFFIGFYPKQLPVNTDTVVVFLIQVSNE